MTLEMVYDIVSLSHSHLTFLAFERLEMVLKVLPKSIECLDEAPDIGMGLAYLHSVGVLQNLEQIGPEEGGCNE